jgi:hypothetical protein
MAILYRKEFLKLLGAGLLGSILGNHSVIARPKIIDNDSPINIIIPRHFKPRTSTDFAKRLKTAVLDTLETHYSEQNIPVWGKMFHQVDLEVRIHWIIQWLFKALEQHQRVYPVDPIIVLAMIMKESYFFEFAVSPALAVGICQFVQPTAQEYQMLCAGTLPEHRMPPYKLPEYAIKNMEYYKLRQERRKYYRANRSKIRFELEDLLKIVAKGESYSIQSQAAEQLQFLQNIDEYDRLRMLARDQFKKYLVANVADRNLFDRNDLNFILGFDERFTYKKPLSSMVLMLARHLRARNGNILPSIIGYNAGLSTTADVGRFKPYGKIPYIQESTTYLSHVLINHHEIASRL